MSLERPLRPLGVPRGGSGGGQSFTSRAREKARAHIEGLAQRNHLPQALLHGFQGALTLLPAGACVILPALSRLSTYCHCARLSSHRTEYNFVLTTLITFSFEHHNRIHKEEEQIAAPPLVVAMQPTQLRGWDRIRNRSRSSLLLAHEGTRAGDFARALSEAGSLGRGTTAEQLRALTELVSLQTRKIDSLEEVAGESRQRLDEMQSVLSD